MSGEVFQKVHISLSSLLALQKANKDVSDALKVLYLVLEEGVNRADQDEFDAVRSAVILGTRVAADFSIRNGKWLSDCSMFAKILAICLQRTSYMENSAVENLTKCIQLFVEFICQNELYSQDFGKSEYVHVFGKLVSFCLEILTDEGRTLEARRCSLLTLLQLVKDDKNIFIQGCSLVLPGLLLKVVQVISKSSTEYLDILENGIRVVASAITYCLNDKSLDIKTFPESSKMKANSLGLNRDDVWIDVASTKLTPLVEIYEKCSKAFNLKLDTVMFDTALLMCQDSSESIAYNVSNKLSEFREKVDDRFSKFLHDKMVKLGDDLPISVRQSISSATALRQLSSLVRSLGPDFSRLIVSHSPPALQLLRAFSSSIRIDASRLRVSRNFNEMFLKELITSLPLQFGVSFQDVDIVCSEFAQHAKYEIVDLLYTEMGDCEPNDKIAMLIILVLVLEKLVVNEERDSEVIALATEFCIDEVKQISMFFIKQREDIVTDASEAPLNDSVLAISAICGLSACSKHLKKEEDQTSLNLLMDGLYRLLQLQSHPNWIVHDSSNVAIRELAKHSDMTLSEFLLENSLYIVNRITLAVRSHSHYIHAPSVLSSLLDEVNDERMFEKAQYITQDLLCALENYNQEWTLGVLRALRSYMKALNRWYPNLEEILTEPEDMNNSILKTLEGDLNDPAPVEVERLPPPPQIQSAEEILKMTKHLLSSQYVPVKITVTQILKEGLHFIRNFENTLLPLLHQNWLTVIQRFNEKDWEVWKVSFEVIEEMVHLSKTFVYRRIRSEFWPKVANFLLAESKNKSFFVHSSSFKLLTSLLTGLPVIFIEIDIDHDDWMEIQPVFRNFTQDHVHAEIRSFAISAIERLDAFISHKKN